MEKHVDAGQKYFEYVKGSCASEAVQICHDCKYSEIVCNRVPAPVPDASQLPKYHYKPVTDTKNVEENGNKREIDDWQPRVNITKLFKDKSLQLQDLQAIQRFSDTFIVEEKYVKERLEHMTLLELTKEKKMLAAKEKQREGESKTFSEIDWIKHYEENTLKSLRVATLNKYLVNMGLDHHKHLKKKDKVSIIQHSIQFENVNIFKGQDNLENLFDDEENVNTDEETANENSANSECGNNEEDRSDELDVHNDKEVVIDFINDENVEIIAVAHDIELPDEDFDSDHSDNECDYF